MARLRRLLGLDALTDSGLERKFLSLVRAAGLPAPETQAWVNGYRVDFYWCDLGLVVETDGWRYHRTPGQQATDHRRDHAHTRGGLTTLRIAEDQIRYEPHAVKQLSLPPWSVSSTENEALCPLCGPQGFIWRFGAG